MENKEVEPAKHLKGMLFTAFIISIVYAGDASIDPKMSLYFIDVIFGAPKIIEAGLVLVLLFYIWQFCVRNPTGWDAGDKMIEIAQNNLRTMHKKGTAHPILVKLSQNRLPSAGDHKVATINLKGSNLFFLNVIGLSTYMPGVGTDRELASCEIAGHESLFWKCKIFLIWAFRSDDFVHRWLPLLFSLLALICGVIGLLTPLEAPPAN